jgi:hypothetical protein
MPSITPDRMSHVYSCHSLQDLDIVAQPEAIKNHIAGLLKCGMTVKQVEEKVFSRGQGPEYR